MGKNSKKKRRARKLTRHHIINTVRGGDNSPENIIFIKNERHQAWHLLFNNMSFLEIAMLLVRTHNFKNGTKLTITEAD